MKIRKNENIQGIEIFGFEFKISAFADDASFLLKIWHLLGIFVDCFIHLHNVRPKFSLLKINCELSELCGIGSLKGVKRAFYRFKVLDVTRESIKILGCHHSYDADIASSRNFSVLLDNIQAVFNLWRTRYLTIEGKIKIFKTLGLSKMQYLAMMSNVLNSVIKETLKVIHNKFLWSNKPAQVKQTTLLGNYR